MRVYETREWVIEKLYRNYATSSPEIEWTCCKGVICGHARRQGISREGLAVYALDGFRHPELKGRAFVVEQSGSLRFL